jgi:hypothetical protein
MSSKPNFLHKKYSPLLGKTLKNALAHRIAKEFPRIGGPRIRQLCADMLLEVLAQHIRPLDNIVHGQLLWMAISVKDPPRHRQRVVDTELVPVLLDVSTAEDVQRRIDRVPTPERLLQRCIRLCKQAHRQGGLLSNCDLAEILNSDDSRIAFVLAEHERASQTVVPRRATLHDVGSGLTHKRIICWKRYAEGKDPHIVAKETYHSLEAVDHYLGMYDRVRCCRLQGLSPEQTAHTLSCTVRLVLEYLAIDDLLKNQSQPKKKT